jgi:Holliday junction DNA helicase RuvA
MLAITDRASPVADRDMIGYLQGKLVDLDESRIIVDVAGIGYEVHLPDIEMRAFRAKLPDDPQQRRGADVALHIYHHVPMRNPTPRLFGFHRKEDKRFFERLLEVADFGPTSAAKAMCIPVTDFATAIERQDVATLSKLPGISKRKGEQIIATLKGKVLSFALLPAPELRDEEAEIGAPDFVADAETILADLGYRTQEITRMIADARQRSPGIADAQSLLEEIWRGEKETSGR